MSECFLNRDQAATYVRAKGLSCAKLTLQKYATVGGGPEYRKFGTRVVYTPGVLPLPALMVINMIKILIKVARHLGAGRVFIHGQCLEEARSHADELARDRRDTFSHDRLAGG